jgi:hypothetical protein
MIARLARLRSRLSYANVTATLALFIALGGTGYAAITLPRDSVGAKQIRSKAVRSSEIRNRAIKLRDIARPARNRLRGQQGPAGPAGPPGAPAVTEHVQVNSGGGATGTGRVAHTTDDGLYTVTFGRDVAGCAYAATLAAVPGGGVPEPSAGRITVASAGGANVIVKTYDAAGNFVPQPFHLTVTC